MSPCFCAFLRGWPYLAYWPPEFKGAPTPHMCRAACVKRRGRMGPDDDWGVWGRAGRPPAADVGQGRGRGYQAHVTAGCEMCILKRLTCLGAWHTCLVRRPSPAACSLSQEQLPRTGMCFPCAPAQHLAPAPPPLCRRCSKLHMSSAPCPSHSQGHPATPYSTAVSQQLQQALRGPKRGRPHEMQTCDMEMEGMEQAETGAAGLESMGDATTLSTSCGQPGLSSHGHHPWGAHALSPGASPDPPTSSQHRACKLRRTQLLSPFAAPPGVGPVHGLQPLAPGCALPLQVACSSTVKGMSDFLDHHQHCLLDETMGTEEMLGSSGGPLPLAHSQSLGAAAAAAPGAASHGQPAPAAWNTPVACMAGCMEPGPTHSMHQERVCAAPATGATSHPWSQHQHQHWQQQCSTWAGPEQAEGSTRSSDSLLLALSSVATGRSSQWQVHPGSRGTFPESLPEQEKMYPAHSTSAPRSTVTDALRVLQGAVWHPSK